MSIITVKRVEKLPVEANVSSSSTGRVNAHRPRQRKEWLGPDRVQTRYLIANGRVGGKGGLI
jgi:hypothetical protein